ncbi:MAG TPA: phytanoyl-CoA dioxygenase family protein [Pseudonocardiaceae bacterium]
MLDEGQVREFAERGYVVIPQVIPADLLAAASRTIDRIIEKKPPGAEVRGQHFYFPDTAKVPWLLALLTETAAWSYMESLTGADTLEVPRQVQVALNIPPFPHRPGRPHIDGYPPLSDGRPGTFTMLAGVLMSDQLGENGGNLWTWPGSHLTHARFFDLKGPDAFFEAAGYPPVDLPEPEQVSGRAGDLLLAHYLLGHNIGGNISDATRRCAYFRIKHRDHDPRWRESLRDAWVDYAPVRELLT